VSCAEGGVLAGGAGDGSAAYFYGLGHEGAEVFVYASPWTAMERLP
jgi:hypothetical protein